MLMLIHSISLKNLLPYIDFHNHFYYFIIRVIGTICIKINTGDIWIGIGINIPPILVYHLCLKHFSGFQWHLQ